MTSLRKVRPHPRAADHLPPAFTPEGYGGHTTHPRSCGCRESRRPGLRTQVCPVVDPQCLKPQNQIILFHSRELLQHSATRSASLCQMPVTGAGNKDQKCKRVGVSVVAQRKQIQLGAMRWWVQSLAWLSGSRIWHCRELWHMSQTRLGSGVAVAVAVA